MARKAAGNGRKRSWTGRMFRALLWTGLVVVATTWLLVLLLRFVPPPTTAFMLERRIAAWRAGERDFRLHYRWTSSERIAPEALIALVAAEDQKFPLHHGFDFAAIQTAIEEADDGEPMRGASTISQQTAKNLFLWGGHSFVRKGLEAYFTVLIELTWPKRRILEVYANTAEFGNGVYGIPAAADVFFHKSPGALTPHEAALLASVLPSPRKLHPDKPSAYVQRRAAWIEAQARQLGGPAYLPH